MPNKENSRGPVECKPALSTIQNAVPVKNCPPVTSKVSMSKTVTKDATMSPTASPNVDSERTELLGSLTTQQQQRTSARVIKKLKLEPQPDKRGKRPDGTTDDVIECETPNKIDEKDLKFPTVKHRMPKALWSTDEKNLFFEALNEFGKDFDAITAHICAKMKKKGMPDVNLKTKTQVSHFYYRTWHKLSKHVHFDENVKKVAQELYALINYGELRKKLVSVNEKVCSRLGEMVLGGSMVVRARGRNVRVRTPMCAALRRLNQITERSCGGRVCGRACVVLRARSAAAWARVQARAHNPRAQVTLSLRTPLGALLRALTDRWSLNPMYKHRKLQENVDAKFVEEVQKEADECQESRLTSESEDVKEDIDDPLNLEPDKILLQEQRLPKKLSLHVGPRPETEIHLPVVSPSEPLSSHKICFSSYLERMCKGRDKDGTSGKIRTPKRQRKDSTSEKEKETDQKKIKTEEAEPKLMIIDETAIDGIELMASYKINQEDDEKPSTEDETKCEEREDISERDVDKYTPEKDKEVSEKDKDLSERDKDMPERDKDTSERDKDMSEKEKDSFSEMEDDEKYNKSDTDNESDQGKDKKDGKFSNLKVKFRLHPKKRGGNIYTLVMENPDEGKGEEGSKEEPPKEEEPKPQFDVDLAIRQLRKGWSVSDAGDLTIGDLYLMFGSRSKLELDYWWAEPTPPLPQVKTQLDKKTDKTQDKVPDNCPDEQERTRESDTDIFSPKNTFSQDSNDGLSGDERKSEQLASPDHKSSSSSTTFKLVSKLINRPQPTVNNTQNGFSLLSDRLKRLLALAGNPHVAPNASSTSRCSCGHVCPQTKKQQKQQLYIPTSAHLQAILKSEPSSPVFRHPTPIAPRPENDPHKSLNLDGLPKWRRGRPRVADQRVVVQRLLPLLPKLPPPSNLIPVKILPNTPPAPPRILPKPPPTSTSDLSFFYVLSESNGQFYFHDGDRRIPITPTTAAPEDENDDEDVEDEDSKPDVKPAVEGASSSTGEGDQETLLIKEKIETTDIGSFLPSESMSLSPSRLLREAEGWLEGAVHDFSLSSFLGHLEGRPNPELPVDSQLQSLMAESSVDYVAKFADLAAEVTDETGTIPDDKLT